MKIYIHILYSEVYFKYWNIEISNSIPFSWQPQYINQNTNANFGNEKQMLELLEAIQSLLWPPSALLDQIFSIYHNLQLTRATHIIICQVFNVKSLQLIIISTRIEYFNLTLINFPWWIIKFKIIHFPSVHGQFWAFRPFLERFLFTFQAKDQRLTLLTFAK